MIIKDKTMKISRINVIRFIVPLFLSLIWGCNDGKLSNSKAEKTLKAEYPRYITSIVQINDHSLSPFVPNELKLLTERGLASYNYIPPGTKGYGCYGKLTEAGSQYLVSKIDYDFIVMAVAKIDLDRVTGIREIPAMNASEVEYTEKIVEVTPVGEIFNDITIGKTYNVSSTFIKYNDGWRIEKLSTKAKKIVLSENNVTTNSQTNSTTSEKKVPYNQPDANARQILQGKWYGTIGKKNFSLNIEAVGGGKLTGYNVAGANQRPVSGSYSFYQEGRACSITLKEPGDDKWDGIFNLDFEVYSDNWAGTGTWKSFNGQLSNPVSLSQRATDNTDDFVSPVNSSNEGDKFIGVWITAKNDEVKISKAGKNYKVSFHPDEDEIFDFTGLFHNGKIKCPLGQNNRDTITFSLVGNKLKFYGEWDGAYPGPETYIFNKR